MHNTKKHTVVGGQARSKGLPTDPRAQPAGAVTLSAAGGWGLVENKRNTHTGNGYKKLSLTRVFQWGFTPCYES
jgi:hypothetical protein